MDMCDICRHAHRHQKRIDIGGVITPPTDVTHALIHYLKGEELPLPSRVTPGTDIGLGSDSGSDRPPGTLTEKEYN